MRISDWSSDVCSSDLQSLRLLPRGAGCCRLVFGRRSKEPLGCSITDYGEPEDGDLVEAAEKLAIPEIGRATCRERVCQYVYISVVDVSLKKNTERLNRRSHPKLTQQNILKVREKMVKSHA